MPATIAGKIVELFLPLVKNDSFSTSIAGMEYGHFGVVNIQASRHHLRDYNYLSAVVSGKKKKKKNHFSAGYDRSRSFIFVR